MKNNTDSDMIALVTGANKGIGYQVAAQLSELGATVLLGARDQQRGDQVSAKLRANGGVVHAVVLDVTDQETVDRAAAHIADRFGRLDVLINNAGIAGTGIEGRGDRRTRRGPAGV